MIQNEIHRDRDCFTKQPSLAKVKQQNILSLSVGVYSAISMDCTHRKSVFESTVTICSQSA